MAEGSDLEVEHKIKNYLAALLEWSGLDGDRWRTLIVEWEEWLKQGREPEEGSEPQNRSETSKCVSQKRNRQWRRERRALTTKM